MPGFSEFSTHVEQGRTCYCLFLSLATVAALYPPLVTECQFGRDRQRTIIGSFESFLTMTNKEYQENQDPTSFKVFMSGQLCALAMHYNVSNEADNGADHQSMWCQKDMMICIFLYLDSWSSVILSDKESANIEFEESLAPIVDPLPLLRPPLSI